MQKSFIEKALIFITTLAVFMVPIIVLPSRLFTFTTSKSFFFIWVSEACFLIWVYLAITTPKYRLNKTLLVTLSVPAFLLLSLTISGILAPSTNLAFWSSFERGTGLIFLYHCFAFMLVIASLVKVHGKDVSRKILWAVFISGVILALATFIDRDALIGNSSYAGAYLIFSFLVGTLFMLEKRIVWKRILIALGLITMFISLMAVAARGATIGLLVGIAISIFIYLSTSSKKVIRVTGITLLTVSLLSILVTGILLIQSSSKIHKEFVQLATESRFTFWKIGVAGIKERPLLGWGLENYPIVFAKYFDPTILEPGKSLEGWVDKPHNAVLEMFVSGGFVGGILFLVFLASFFALPIYLYKKKIFSNIELSIFVGMLIAYNLQNMIIFDIIPTYVALFTVFGIFCGSMLPPQKTEKLKIIPGLNKTTKRILATVCVLLFLPGWFFLSHLPTKKAKAIYALFNTNQAERDFSVMSGISPMGAGRDVGYAADQMIETDEYNINGVKNNPKLIPGVHYDIELFLSEVDKLKFSGRSDFRLWLDAARLVTFDMTITQNFSDDSLTRATAYIDHARELSPNDPRVYTVYGQIYTYKKDLPKAYEYFLQAYNLDPKIPSSKEYLDQFEKMFGLSKKSI